MQAQLKDAYSSLTSQILEKLENGNDYNFLRSINVSLNSLLKVPEGLTKNLLVLNLSRNRIKSLNNIEVCRRLVFLNASHNQIQTVSTIGLLQSLKELYLANNWLPSATLKEFNSLKSLKILDLSQNKLSADIEKWSTAFKTTSIRNLYAISTKGNLGLDSKISQFKSVLLALFPSLKHINKEDMILLSQYGQVNSPWHEIAFTKPPPKRAGQLTLSEMIPAVVKNRASRVD